MPTVENLEETEKDPRGVNGRTRSVKEYFCPHCHNRVSFTTEVGFEAHLEYYHGIPSKTLKWLRQRNFENLIHAHLEKLTKIQGNRYRKNILSRRERRILIHEGVIVVDSQGYKEKKTEYRLTEEALTVLSKI